MPYQIKGKYIDYGEIINSTGLADGAIIYSGWVDDAWWIKRMILKVKSTQAYTVLIKRRDSNGVEDWSSTLDTGLSSTGGAYAGLTYDGQKAVCGYSFQIGIRNDSGGDSSDVQLNFEGLGDQ